MFVFSLAGSRDSNEDNIDASDSDMEKNSADENTEMQELCDEVCSDYLPECGGYSGAESESDRDSE
jgi:hypothetical protein